MSMVFLGMTHCRKCWAKLDGEIGLCESCRQAEERERKSEGKCKLIDILNKIANGELKEGTKVIWGATEFVYKNFNLESETENSLYDYIGKSIGLLAEVELIEPDHFADVGKMAEHIREDTKMIEPTDNTKIEELDIDSCGLRNEYNSQGDVYARGFSIEIFREEIIDKLNEVIRKINKED